MLRGYGRFPKAARVRRRDEYDRIHQRGVRLHRPQFTVVCLKSTLENGDGARFGCAVSRKVGNAVVRNRLKRLMRELFRQTRSGLPDVDLVTILKPSAAGFAKEGLEKFAQVLVPAWLEAAERALRSSGKDKRQSSRKRGSDQRTGRRK